MFDISLNWVNGFWQVVIYALVIGGVLWVLSKVEIKERKDK